MPLLAQSRYGLVNLSTCLRCLISSPGDLRVVCYAGYRGEETPQRFFLGERAVGVVEVIDRWTAPDHRYFKCRGSDGDIYILRHDSVQERWELTMFESAAGQEDRGY